MNQFSFSISVSFVTIGYVIYLAITSSGKIRNFLSPDPSVNVYHILFQRLTGIFIFGILPVFLLLMFSDLKYLSFSVNKDTLYWALLIALIIIPVNFLNSKKPGNLALYPQIRNKTWSVDLILASALSWVSYLFAYEMLFRGIFLFSSVEILGYWPAIILNTGIYSLVHYPKDLKEALGAIPFGIIICILTLKTGSFIIAFLVHTVLALSNEWFSIYALSRSVSIKK